MFECVFCVPREGVDRRDIGRHKLRLYSMGSGRSRTAQQYVVPNEFFEEQVNVK
jgi:hypothetical protein